MVRRVINSSIVTMLFVSSLVVFAILTNGLAGPNYVQRRDFGTGFLQVVQRGRWWTPVTSVFLTNGGPELVFVIVCAIALVGVSERLLGSARTLLALVVTAAFGAAVGITVQAIGALAGELWSSRLSGFVSFDPMTAIVGVAMTATAFAERLWRRRGRVLILSTVLVFLLYSGQPPDLYRLCGALAGLGLGYALRPSDGSPLWPRSSHHETRVLLAAVIAITGLGPAVTLLSTPRLGPLAPLGMLLGNVRPTARAALDRCIELQSNHNCLRDINLERINGAGPVLLTLLPLVALLVAALGILRGRRFGAWL
ncbi:MAG TPA: hypothetical protein VIJ11_10365, partial [Galbitalea sp.]